MKLVSSVTALTFAASVAVAGSAIAQDGDVVLAEALDHAALTMTDARMPKTVGYGNCYRKGADGSQEVTVRYDIKPDGSVANVKAIESTDPCFERYARRAVRQWDYQPVAMNGAPVTVKGLQTTISFSEPSLSGSSAWAY